MVNDERCWHFCSSKNTIYVVIMKQNDTRFGTTHSVYQFWMIKKKLDVHPMHILFTNLSQYFQSSNFKDQGYFITCSIS